MTDCKINELNRNLPDSEKVTEPYLNHHDHEHSVVQSVIMENVIEKRSIEKHPQNGMMHIPADSNGLISQNKDSIKAEILDTIENLKGTPVPNSCLPCTQEVIKTTEEQHECQCEKVETTEKDICLTTTDFQRVSLNDSELEGDVFNGINYAVYESEQQMPDIMKLITKDLSEPYSIYTYRYFIHNWPKLCFLAMDEGKCVGAVVCKLDLHKKMVRRGYIAMLAVDSDYRRRKLGSHLVLKAIKAMIADDCDEVVLETEITNQAALRLYENMGFVRDKRLFRYYLNGVDALRLKLWLR